jgi:hypothetical protein
MLVFILAKNKTLIKMMELFFKHHQTKYYSLDSTKDAIFFINDLRPEYLIIEDEILEDKNFLEAYKLIPFMNEVKLIQLGSNHQGLLKTYQQLALPLDMEKLIQWWGHEKKKD